MTDQTKGEDLASVRFAIGVGQGVLLLLLWKAGQGNAWPASDPWLYATLSLSTLFVLTTTLVALGQLRRATFVFWVMAAVALVAATVWHAAAREVGGMPPQTALLYAVIPAILFVAYHLVAAADADRRPVAHYRTYFDIGWKNGVQLALSLAFVGALWLLLFLGASLFELINVKGVREIIEQDWFIFPVTASMFALAVHLTDVRIGLINGIRTVSLVLMSWLLPVITVLIVAFVATLPATGLKPLWDTQHATPILLTAAVTLIVLINAAYQDGESQAVRFLQFTARVASLALAPLVALAAYSIWLRIAQHGLSPDRVIGLAVIAVAACYAAGYAIAAIWPGRWMKPLEITNVLAALVAIGLATALLTPIADPARLSVADQLRRLRAGLVTPDAFDFNFLRFEAARYGRDALQALARDNSSPQAQAIAAKAQASLTQNARMTPAEPVPSMKDELAHVIMKPPAQLPESFVNQDWQIGSALRNECQRERSTFNPCAAYLLDFDGDETTEVLIGRNQFLLYKRAPDGRWRSLGHFDTWQCGTALKVFLDAGQYKLVPPRMAELELNGARMKLSGCPE